MLKRELCGLNIMGRFCRMPLMVTGGLSSMKALSWVSWIADVQSEGGGSMVSAGGEPPVRA